MLENNLKKSYLLFILSIPTFFILSIVALYFIEMDEWVEGTGQIVPSDEYVLYLPENAQLKEIKVIPGATVKKGEVLATFISLDREEEIARLQKDSLQLQDEIKLREISHSILLLSPIEEKFENAANELSYLREKVVLLSNRLLKLDQLKDKGILSAEEVEDIRIKLAEAKNDEKAIELRANKDIKKMGLLLIEKSNQEIIGLRNRLISLVKQQEFLKQRMIGLTITASDDGVVISSPLKFTGIQLQKGATLFSIAKSNDRMIEMSLSEKNIINIKKDLKVRFEPNTYSVFELDYFWGNITQIIPQGTVIKEKNTPNQYTVYSNIKLFGRENVSLNESRKIPFGSSGKCAIAIGRKSLLLQLIGWN